jgi:hypothetical protein
LGVLGPGAEGVVGGDGEVLGLAEVVVAVGERGLGEGDGLDAGVDDGGGSVVEYAAAGEAALGVCAAGGGGEGDGEATPVDHIGTGGVGPVHVSPGGGVGVVLVEHVVLAAPVDGGAGVVHPAAGGEEVEAGALGIVGCGVVGSGGKGVAGEGGGGGEGKGVEDGASGEVHELGCPSMRGERDGMPVGGVGLVLFGGGGEEGGDAGGLFEFEEIGCACAGVDGGDVFEGAIDGCGLAADVAQGCLNGADLLFDFVHEAAEFFELAFGAGEDAPDFVAFFLDGEGVEPHLEAGEDGHEGGRASDGDAAVLLDVGLQAGAADDFSVEAFGGQEHDGVGHGGGGIDVFVADELALRADGAFEGFAGSGDFIGCAALVDVFESLPVFAGEFGVDGEEDAGTVAVGELEGVFDGFGGAGFDAGVLEVLLGGEHLFELLAEEELTDAAAGLDVGEDFFEVADAGGQFLHLAEAFLDCAEVGGDLAEGFCEAGLEGGVELFVDGLAHLFELGGVGFVEFVEAVFDGGAELVLVVGVAGGEVGELGVEGLAKGGLLLGALGGEGGEALGDGVHLALDGFAEFGGGGFVVFAEAVEAGGEGAA